MVTQDDMELETGLFSDLDGKITDARFGPNPRPEYQLAAGIEPGLVLTIDSPDLENPIEEWYSAGSKKEWQAVSDGKEMVSGADPDLHRFHANAKAGALVTAMFRVVGVGDIKKGQQFFIKRGFKMTQSGFYAGLNFHWKRIPIGYEIEGRTISSQTLLPVEYLGESEALAVSGEVVAEALKLDKVVVEISAGLTERELKRKALGNDDLKANQPYMKELVSGNKIQELINAGALAKGPDEKFI